MVLTIVIFVTREYLTIDNGDVMEIFKRELDEYNTEINPVKNYLEQAITFVSKYYKLSKEEATQELKNIIKNNKPKNPIVKYVGRDETDATVIKESKLTDYINDSVKNGEIVTPSLTVYTHPSKKKSLHAKFLAGNIKRRSEHKHKSFVEYQAGNYLASAHHNVLQKVMKIFNNSLSGAYASMSTALYNPSAHYTLTSITRSVASIGNAVSESVIAGNKCFYTPDSIINYITSIVTCVNMKKVILAISRYKLYEPSVDDVMEMILKSSRRYWKSSKYEDIIRNYLSKLASYELAAVMYVNDLHHMKKHNEELIKDFIGRLGKRTDGIVNDPLKVLNRNLEGVNNLVHHICMEDIKGINVDYGKLYKTNPDILNVLAATADNVYTVLLEYRLLIKTFFTTDILPIDVGSIKDCHRDTIVLSDTDSTCGSYDMWVEWYFGNTKYSPAAVGLSAAVMTINTQVIDHNIRIFSKNMNISKDCVSLLKMKNEFFWLVFITANVSKHYYADTWIQEGNVYAKALLELKGVHVFGSAGNQSIVKKAHDDMHSVLTTIAEGGTIDAKSIITKVADLERYILDAINKGDVSVFKIDKINSPDSYKLEDKSKTPYFHHMLWTRVFKDKYGDPGNPTYMTVKIPTVIKSKAKCTEYLNSIKDTEIKEKLIKCLSDNGKDNIGTFRVPLTIAGNSGMPEEMLDAVDKHRVVLDNMNVYYILLATIGIFRGSKLLFSESGY